MLDRHPVFGLPVLRVARIEKAPGRKAGLLQLLGDVGGQASHLLGTRAWIDAGTREGEPLEGVIHASTADDSLRKVAIHLGVSFEWVKDFRDHCPTAAH